MKGSFRTLGMLGILLMAVAIWKMSILPLWNYWPLALGAGFCLVLVPVYAWCRFSLPHIGLALTTGVILSISFPPVPAPILTMVGFIPLLYVIDRQIDKAPLKMIYSVGALSFLAFLVWNVGATFWVMNTAFVAGLFANTANAFLMSLPIVGYALVRKYFIPRYHWIAWIAMWLCFEYVHYNWQLHWPWLTLGNAFASWPWAIQWYDITGVLGGSLWALIMNWFLYHAFFYKKDRRRNYIVAAAILFGPMIFSLVYMPGKMDNNEKISFAIIQPNFEPHYEKFDVPENQQIRKIRSMIDSAVSDTTDYLILPETVFTLRMNDLESDPGYRMLKSVQDRFPQLELIVGLATQRVLEESEADGPFTRKTIISSGQEVRWEAANTAMYLHKDKREFYYKSKLVPGAESFPYSNILFFLEPIVNKLGGSVKGFRTQESASVFEGKASLAPVICYESIFSEYCRQYIAKGADIFTVITNDGWWDNTPGHKQHFAYSLLLAIQHRRSVARAANTGISALILPDGSVTQQTDYEEDAVITGQLPINEEITFYTRWGDIAGRIAIFVLIILILQGTYLAVKYFTPNRTQED